MSAEDWHAIADRLRERAQEMHRAREAGLTLCRALIQTSASCIRHIHRHQFHEAEALLQKAKEIASEAKRSLAPHPEVLHAGFYHDAEKEMVEAAAVLAIVKALPFPTPESLDAMPMSYLNGMGEAASECRRFALDQMRFGNIAEAERILAQMEAVYDELITFDYSDAMTGGLRRTCDALRAVIERTRSDLTATASQRELIEELRLARKPPV